MCYPPQPSASADNTNFGLDNYRYHAQPHPVIVNCFEVSGYSDEARRTSFWYSFLNQWPTIVIFHCCAVSLIKQYLYAIKTVWKECVIWEFSVYHNQLFVRHG